MSTFVFFLFRKKTPSVADIFSTFFGICYAGLLPVYFILIRNISSGTDNSILDPGAGFLLLTLLTICASDIGAYYSGRKLGKKPLYLSISPNKTVEGAIGGSLSGVILAVIIGYFIHINIIPNKNLPFFYVQSSGFFPCMFCIIKLVKEFANAFNHYRIATQKEVCFVGIDFNSRLIFE